VPTSREKRYKNLLKQLVVATNRENRREDYRDPPTKNPYSRMELT
jgi:hypothetical protein